MRIGKWLGFAFYLTLFIALVLALLIVVFDLYRISGWIAIVFAIFAILVNGYIAMIEDQLPGGFNNPRPEDKNK